MKEENRLASNNGKPNLVFGLNLDGEIVQFDVECQKITGYSRTDVLNKKIDEFLIPTSYIEQWKKIFDSVKKDKNIDNLKIPWLTSDGLEILISWSSEIFKDKKGTVEHICFIGKNLGNKQSKKSYIIKSQNENNDKKIHKQDDIEINEFKKWTEIHSYKSDNKNELRYKTSKKDNVSSVKNEKKIALPLRKNKIVFERDGKTIYFETTPSLESDKNPGTQKKILPREIKKSGENFIESDTLNKKVIDISKKYEKLNDKLKELEKKDRKLERKNKILEKNLKNLKMYLKKSHVMQFDKKSYDNKKNLQKTKYDGHNQTKFSKIFHDPLGINMRREEFEIRTHELDQRAKELEKLEDQLIQDRKIHDKRIAEFVTWKEKLFSLESEIEKRRADLVEQEEILRKDIFSLESSENNSDTVSPETDDALKSDENVVQDNYHDILDKIPQCAAIIQRSIVKQVNNSFVELIGFETDEIVDKSLFDFIASEGLVEIEKYYLGRLKGNDSSKYETIFSTKDNSKIQVEVNIKPTIYNGEKAEIAIVTEMEDLQTDIDNPVIEKDNQRDKELINIGVEDGPENSIIEQENKKETDNEIKDKGSEDKTNGENKKSQDEIDAMIKKMKDTSETNVAEKAESKNSTLEKPVEEITEIEKNENNEK